MNKNKMIMIFFTTNVLIIPRSLSCSNPLSILPIDFFIAHVPTTHPSGASSSPLLWAHLVSLFLDLLQVVHSHLKIHI